MLDVELLQQGVLKEWLKHLTQIERPFQAKIMIVKVEAIQKNNKSRC